MIRLTPTDERGQAAVLVVGIALVCFATAGLAVDGTRAWLARRTLQNVADAAALGAAGEVDQQSVYDGRRPVLLDPDAAEKQALRLLASSPMAHQGSIEVRGSSVGVSVRSRIRTSFLSLIGIHELEVGAEATAAPVYGGT